MKKEEIAHMIVRGNYGRMEIYHEYRRQGYCEAAAKTKAVQWYTRHYTKNELIDIINEL